MKQLLALVALVSAILTASCGLKINMPTLSYTERAADAAAGLAETTH